MTHNFYFVPSSTLM